VADKRIQAIDRLIEEICEAFAISKLPLIETPRSKASASSEVSLSEAPRSEEATSHKVLPSEPPFSDTSAYIYTVGQVVDDSSEASASSEVAVSETPTPRGAFFFSQQANRDSFSVASLSANYYE
jgi:hypothetical protein